MRDIHATHNLIAVSANARETAINTEQTLDTTMLCSIDDTANLEPRREHNGSQPTGKEEPDTIYDLGATGSLPLSFEMAQPQHFAFLLGYGLGSVSTAARGDGYRHTITPITGDLDALRSNPSFTAAMRYGSTVLKRRLASLVINSIEATFAADDWVKIKGEAISTGKVTESVTEESITAAENVTTLTLATNGVQGSTAAERLDNVHRIVVELSSGVWTEVAYSAVSAAAPAAITITAPGEGVTERTFKVLYAPTAETWMTFPSRVVETPLRISQMTLNVGGAWDGSAFAGGRQLTAELGTLTYRLDNAMQVKFVPGSSGAYAGRALRGGRTQTLSLDREFREYIMQRHIAANDTFGVHIVCQGDFYDSTNHYQVELVFPKVGVLKAPVSVRDKRLAEVGDLQVLEHDTYGSVICRVDNKGETYAA